MRQVTYPGYRLVLQDRLELLQNLRRQLGDDIQCLEVVGNVFRLRGAQDDRRCVGVDRDPRKRQLRDGAPEFCSEGKYSINL